MKLAFDYSESKHCFNIVMKQLESLFMMFCKCIPAVSMYSWLAGSDNGDRQGFIGFDQRNGDRLDDPSLESRDASISSWQFKGRLSHDSCWWLTAEEILNDETTASLHGIFEGVYREEYSWRMCR